MNRKRLYKEAAERVDTYDDTMVFEALRSGVKKQFSSAPPEIVEEMARFFFREVKRRVTTKVGAGQATMDVFDEIDRTAIRVDGTAVTHTPFSLYLEAERCGVYLTAVNNLILQIRAALRGQFSDRELYDNLAEATSACELIFYESADETPLTNLRNNPEAIRLTTSLAVDGTLPKGHQHPDAEEYKSSIKIRVIHHCRSVSAFLAHGIALREIKSLQKYLQCTVCLIHFAQHLEEGHISPELIHELVSNISFVKLKGIDPQKAVHLLKLFEKHGKPCSFSDYIRLIETVGETISPEVMETILSYTHDPNTIKNIANVLAKGEATLIWLLTKYHEMRGQLSLDQWIHIADRFGEEAHPLAVRVGDRAGQFLDGCKAIGDEQARAIVKHMVPATTDEYICLSVFQTEYPQTPWEVRARYATSKLDLEMVRIRLMTHERYKISHDWLLATSSSENPEAEALALTWLFERDLNRMPTSTELTLLASEEFIHDARRRGLRQLLRKHAGWIDHVHANHRVRAEETEASAPEAAPPAVERDRTVRPAPAAPDLQLTWPEPTDLCERRIWIGWRIIKTLWQKRKIGGVYALFENIRKDVPRHLGRELDEAVQALQDDGIFLITERGRHQISLNPDRMDFIQEILARRLPAAGFFTNWVNAARRR